MGDVYWYSFSYYCILDKKRKSSTIPAVDKKEAIEIFHEKHHQKEIEEVVFGGMKGVFRW